MIEDLKLPLPGDLKDISKASALVSGVIEDRIPALLNSVRNQTWDEDATLQAFEFRRDTIGFPDILLVERTDPTNVIFEIEAKSWYILSRDALTARFETSPEIMRTGHLLRSSRGSLMESSAAPLNCYGFTQTTHSGWLWPETKRGMESSRQVATESCSQRIQPVLRGTSSRHKRVVSIWRWIAG